MGLERGCYDTIAPMNFSQITDDLFIGTMPFVEDYQRLHDLGVRLVINMRLLVPPHENPFDQPLDFMWLPTIDSPTFPISLQKLVRGAHAALETIREGGKVYTHCEFGRHRGVAMGAAVLIAQGHGPEKAMDLIKEFRPVADPQVFYIRRRIMRFAKRWKRIGAQK